MKKLLPILLGIALFCPSFAQDPPASPWSLGVYYSFSRNEAAVVASNKLTTIEDFLNIKGFSVDINAFGGATQSGDAIGGFSATISRTLGKNLTGFIGPAIEGDLMQMNQLRLGVHLGVNYRF